MMILRNQTPCDVQAMNKDRGASAAPNELRLICARDYAIRMSANTYPGNSEVLISNVFRLIRTLSHFHVNDEMSK